MRQQLRCERFQSAFQAMPLWETWTTERFPQTDAEYYNACRDAGEILERPIRIIEHCKVIPRRLRRQMARVKSKRPDTLS